ncbi:MAG: phage holin family protein [bacterium]|nr:phage holin family protein [bacterium]
MKSLIRKTVFYAISLFLAELVIDGVVIKGGIPTILFGGFILTLLFMFVKPILSIITFPLNLITLGIFAWLVNVFILYLLVVLIPSVSIHAYTFQGFRFAGFVMPKMDITIFFVYLVTALLIYAVTSLLSWITK